MKIGIIGGGAAGFFLAIHLKKNLPNAMVTIFERNEKVLAKVKISGGGRCNVTNTFSGVSNLQRVYPRGFQLMKRLLKEFGPKDTFHWFESHGVPLVVQEDHCVFPLSQDSSTIINCFKEECKRLDVKVLTKRHVVKITPNTDIGKLIVEFKDPGHHSEEFDRIALTTGGAHNGEGHDWLADLGHEIISPCPSLYTFTINEPKLLHLMGIVIEHCKTSIPGTKFQSDGPLLITHWGVSGPAILKLSSYASRTLKDSNFKSPLLINWSGESNIELLHTKFSELLKKSGNKTLGNLKPFNLQTRLWHYLLERCKVSAETICCEISKKAINRILEVVANDKYEIEGKGSYRDEFVTCGGVSLNSISYTTLESKCCKGLYFAGEVLDIDGVTGGFNFQAAWSTSFTAAKSICQSFSN